MGFTLGIIWQDIYTSVTSMPVVQMFINQINNHQPIHFKVILWFLTCRPANTEAEVIDTHEVKKEAKFRPGAIHDSSRRRFWEEELKAGKWVMNVLENGYVIPF